jgi:sugar O-acyltransferase (sialic acid O-acetyltransferase NeuD family)
MQKKLIIIGAGAHAKVILEAVQRQGIYEIIGFCADNVPVGEKVFNNYTILDDAMLSASKTDPSISFIVAVGDNKAREQFFNNALLKYQPGTIIDPLSNVSPSSKIGEGTVVLSNVCISSSSVIGKNSIINIAAIIDHDCNIGSHVHIGIGSIVGNNSTVNNFSLTQVGKIINPYSEV